MSALDRQRQIELNIGKTFINAMGGGQCQVWKWDAFRVFCGYHCYQKWDRGLEFPYLIHCDCMAVLKCLARGWLASLPMTARRCSPNLVLKGFPVSRENGFQIRKFEPSVTFLVAMIAAKDTKCVSFPNLALSTPHGINERFPYV